MSREILEADESRGQPGDWDVDAFAESVRRLALDARDALVRPDGTLGELIGLRRRVLDLLEEVPGTRVTGIVPWLLAVRQRIDARLQSSVEDLESLVA